MREKRFELEIGPDLRVRFMFRDPQPHPRATWSAQLELYHPRLSGWRWVVRYDDAGGTGHRDRYGIRRHEPINLPAERGEAARFAFRELRDNAAAYTEDYLVTGEDRRRP